ncbi:MAG TPA: ornithine carbamoyltransferase [Gemmatimonadales bacterium]|nr:ornithine carbamoyltransferase [Gemmatimonadales bacterium]
MKRDFLALSDLDPDELASVVALAARLKRGDTGAGSDARLPLEGRSIGLIFAKSSTRTRVSFEVGAFQLGAHSVFLSMRDIQLGRGEPMRDTARVLSRYLDAMVIRTHSHQDAEELARYATVPVINGLTDLLHPCQVLADLLTVQESLGTWQGKIVAWVGDGNNVANGWIDAAGLLGFELRLACPEGYEPDRKTFERNAARTRIVMTEEPEEAVAGAHVVNTDVWSSMGQEEQAEQRRKAFEGYTVTTALMDRAAPDAIFLHCLPAHRGEEVEEAVLEGPRSRVWDQAENRLHVQKALLVRLVGGEEARTLRR